MASLRKQIKKVMSAKVTAKAMELLIGLNEKNELQLGDMTRVFAKRLVKEYFKAIKKQNKAAVKAKTQKQKENSSPVAYLESVSIAS